MKPCVLVLAVTILLCGCGFFGGEKYVCSIDNVKSVQIVRLDKWVQEEARYEYTVLTEILDKIEFLQRLNGLKQYEYWNDPSVMQKGDTVVRIDYENGDYDLLGLGTTLIHSPDRYKSESGNGGWRIYIDPEQLGQLISDYWQP